MRKALNVNSTGRAGLFQKAISLSVVLSFTLSSFIPFHPTAFASQISSPVQSTGLIVPNELGRVTDSHVGVNGKTVVYIEDAHASMQAQERIAEIITHLVSEGNVKTVFEEGYEGPVPSDELFGFIQDEVSRREVSYFLMDRLRLSGAEFAHINRKKDFSLVGADSISLHLENISWYQEAAKTRSDVVRDLDAMLTHVENLANRYFPREIKKWLKSKSRHEAGKLGLLDYLKQTVRFVREVGNAESVGQFGMKYPSLSLVLLAESSRDAAVLARLNTIDSQVVFSELVRLEDEVIRAHLTRDEDRQILESIRALRLFERFNEIEVTQNEHVAVRENLNRFNTEALAEFIFARTQDPLVLSRTWERAIQPILKFYDTAGRRDRSVATYLKQFVRQEGEDTAVLVFGGFHATSIKSILRQEGFSYHVVAPKMASVDDRHVTYYKQLMSVGHHPFEIPVPSEASRPASTHSRATLLGMDVVRQELREIATVVAANRNLSTQLLHRKIEQHLSSYRSERHDTKSVILRPHDPSNRAKGSQDRRSFAQRLDVGLRMTDVGYDALRNYDTQDRPELRTKDYSGLSVDELLGELEALLAPADALVDRSEKIKLHELAQAFNKAAQAVDQSELNKIINPIYSVIQELNLEHKYIYTAKVTFVSALSWALVRTARIQSDTKSVVDALRSLFFVDAALDGILHFPKHGDVEQVRNILRFKYPKKIVAQLGHYRVQVSARHKYAVEEAKPKADAGDMDDENVDDSVWHDRVELRISDGANPWLRDPARTDWGEVKPHQVSLLIRVMLDRAGMTLDELVALPAEESETVFRTTPIEFLSNGVPYTLDPLFQYYDDVRRRKESGLTTLEFLFHENQLRFKGREDIAERRELERVVTNDDRANFKRLAEEIHLPQWMYLFEQNQTALFYLLAIRYPNKFEPDTLYSLLTQAFRNYEKQVEADGRADDDVFTFSDLRSAKLERALARFWSRGFTKDLKSSEIKVLRDTIALQVMSRVYYSLWDKVASMKRAQDKTRAQKAAEVGQKWFERRLASEAKPIPSPLRPIYRLIAGRYARYANVDYQRHVKFTNGNGSAELMLHQVEGVYFARHHNQNRILLTDEMGVGKTVQSLIAAEDKDAERVLIFAPRLHMLKNWEHEIQQWLGKNQSIAIIDGTGQARVQKLQQAKADGVRFILINYDALASSISDQLIDEINDWSPDFIIGDEIHHLRTRGTGRAKAFRKIRKENTAAIYLTGTGVVNQIGDLWVPLNAIDPERFPNYEEFLGEFAEDPVSVAYLNLELYQKYMLGRTIDQVMGHLPKKHKIQKIPVVEDDEQLETSKAEILAFDDKSNEIEIFAHRDRLMKILVDLDLYHRTEKKFQYAMKRVRNILKITKAGGDFDEILELAKKITRIERSKGNVVQALSPLLQKVVALAKQIVELEESDGRSNAAKRTRLRQTKRLARKMLSLLQEGKQKYIHESPPKYRAAVDLIKEIIKQPDQRIGVFSRYRSVVRRLQEMLAAELPGGEEAAVLLDSERHKKYEAKDAIIRGFNTNKRHKVFLSTMDLAGEGITIKANHVMFIDLPYTDAKVKQVVGRFYRWGQEQEVFVYAMYVFGTIDDDVLETIEKKRDLFQGSIRGRMKLDDRQRAVDRLERVLRQKTKAQEARELMARIYNRTKHGHQDFSQEGWANIARLYWETKEDLAAVALTKAYYSHLLHLHDEEKIDLRTKKKWLFAASGPSIDLYALLQMEEEDKDEQGRGAFTRRGIDIRSLIYTELDYAQEMLDLGYVWQQTAAFPGTPVTQQNADLTEHVLPEQEFDFITSSEIGRQSASATNSRGVVHRVWALAQLANSLTEGGLMLLWQHNAAVPEDQKKRQQLEAYLRGFGLELVTPETALSNPSLDDKTRQKVESGVFLLLRKVEHVPLSTSKLKKMRGNGFHFLTDEHPRSGLARNRMPTSVSTSNGDTNGDAFEEEETPSTNGNGYVPFSRTLVKRKMTKSDKRLLLPLKELKTILAQGKQGSAALKAIHEKIRAILEGDPSVQFLLRVIGLLEDFKHHDRRDDVDAAIAELEDALPEAVGRVQAKGHGKKKEPGTKTGTASGKKRSSEQRKLVPKTITQDGDILEVFTKLHGFTFEISSKQVRSGVQLRGKTFLVDASLVNPKLLSVEERRYLLQILAYLHLDALRPEDTVKAQAALLIGLQNFRLLLNKREVLEALEKVDHSRVDLFYFFVESETLPPLHEINRLLKAETSEVQPGDVASVMARFSNFLLRRRGSDRLTPPTPADDKTLRAIHREARAFDMQHGEEIQSQSRGATQSTRRRRASSNFKMLQDILQVHGAGNFDHHAPENDAYLRAQLLPRLEGSAQDAYESWKQFHAPLLEIYHASKKDSRERKRIEVIYRVLMPDDFEAMLAANRKDALNAKQVSDVLVREHVYDRLEEKMRAAPELSSEEQSIQVWSVVGSAIVNFQARNGSQRRVLELLARSGATRFAQPSRQDAILSFIDSDQGKPFRHLPIEELDLVVINDDHAEPTPLVVIVHDKSRDETDGEPDVIARLSVGHSDEEVVGRWYPEMVARNDMPTKWALGPEIDELRLPTAVGLKSDFIRQHAVIVEVQQNAFADANVIDRYLLYPWENDPNDVWVYKLPLEEDTDAAPEYIGGVRADGKGVRELDHDGLRVRFMDDVIQAAATHGGLRAREAYPDHWDGDLKMAKIDFLLRRIPRPDEEPEDMGWLVSAIDEDDYPERVRAHFDLFIQPDFIDATMKLIEMLSDEDLSPRAAKVLRRLFGALLPEMVEVIEFNLDWTVPDVKDELDNEYLIAQFEQEQNEKRWKQKPRGNENENFTRWLDENLDELGREQIRGTEARATLRRLSSIVARNWTHAREVKKAGLDALRSDFIHFAIMRDIQFEGVSDLNGLHVTTVTDSSEPGERWRQYVVYHPDHTGRILARLGTGYQEGNYQGQWHVNWTTVRFDVPQGEYVREKHYSVYQETDFTPEHELLDGNGFVIEQGEDKHLVMQNPHDRNSALIFEMKDGVVSSNPLHALDLRAEGQSAVFPFFFVVVTEDGNLRIVSPSVNHDGQEFKTVFSVVTLDPDYFNFGISPSGEREESSEGQAEEAEARVPGRYFATGDERTTGTSRHGESWHDIGEFTKGLIVEPVHRSDEPTGAPRLIVIRDPERPIIGVFELDREGRIGERPLDEFNIDGEGITVFIEGRHLRLRIEEGVEYEDRIEIALVSDSLNVVPEREDGTYFLYHRVAFVPDTYPDYRGGKFELGERLGRNVPTYSDRSHYRVGAVRLHDSDFKDGVVFEDGSTKDPEYYVAIAHPEVPKLIQIFALESDYSFPDEQLKPVAEFMMDSSHVDLGVGNMRFHSDESGSSVWLKRDNNKMTKVYPATFTPGALRTDEEGLDGKGIYVELEHDSQAGIEPAGPFERRGIKISGSVLSGDGVIITNVYDHVARENVAHLRLVQDPEMPHVIYIYGLTVDYQSTGWQPLNKLLLNDPKVSVTRANHRFRVQDGRLLIHQLGSAPKDGRRRRLFRAKFIPGGHVPFEFPYTSGRLVKKKDAGEDTEIVKDYSPQARPSKHVVSRKTLEGAGIIIEMSRDTRYQADRYLHAVLNPHNKSEVLVYEIGKDGRTHVENPIPLFTYDLRGGGELTDVLTVSYDHEHDQVWFHKLWRMARGKRHDLEIYQAEFIPEDKEPNPFADGVVTKNQEDASSLAITREKHSRIPHSQAWFEIEREALEGDGVIIGEYVSGARNRMVYYHLFSDPNNPDQVVIYLLDEEGRLTNAEAGPLGSLDISSPYSPGVRLDFMSVGVNEGGEGKTNLVQVIRRKGPFSETHRAKFIPDEDIPDEEEPVSAVSRKGKYIERQENPREGIKLDTRTKKDGGFGPSEESYFAVKLDALAGDGVIVEAYGRKARGKEIGYVRIYRDPKDPNLLRIEPLTEDLRVHPNENYDDVVIELNTQVTQDIYRANVQVTFQPKQPDRVRVIPQYGTRRAHRKQNIFRAQFVPDQEELVDYTSIPGYFTERERDSEKGISLETRRPRRHGSPRRKGDESFFSVQRAALAGEGVIVTSTLLGSGMVHKGIYHVRIYTDPRQPNMVRMDPLTEDFRLHPDGTFEDEAWDFESSIEWAVQRANVHVRFVPGKPNQLRILPHHYGVGGADEEQDRIYRVKFVPDDAGVSDEADGVREASEPDEEASAEFPYPFGYVVSLVIDVEGIEKLNPARDRDRSQPMKWWGPIGRSTRDGLQAPGLIVENYDPKTKNSGISHLHIFSNTDNPDVVYVYGLNEDKRLASGHEKPLRVFTLPRDGVLETDSIGETILIQLSEEGVTIFLKDYRDAKKDAKGTKVAPANLLIDAPKERPYPFGDRQLRKRNLSDSTLIWQPQDEEDRFQVDRKALTGTGIIIKNYSAKAHGFKDIEHLHVFSDPQNPNLIYIYGLSADYRVSRERTTPLRVINLDRQRTGRAKLGRVEIEVLSEQYLRVKSLKPRVGQVRSGLEVYRAVLVPEEEEEVPSRDNYPFGKGKLIPLAEGRRQGIDRYSDSSEVESSVRGVVAVDRNVLAGDGIVIETAGSDVYSDYYHVFLDPEKEDRLLIYRLKTTAENASGYPVIENRTDRPVFDAELEFTGQRRTPGQVLDGDLVLGWHFGGQLHVGGAARPVKGIYRVQFVPDEDVDEEVEDDVSDGRDKYVPRSEKPLEGIGERYSRSKVGGHDDIIIVERSALAGDGIVATPAGSTSRNRRGIYHVHVYTDPDDPEKAYIRGLDSNHRVIAENSMILDTRSDRERQGYLGGVSFTFRTSDSGKLKIVRRRASRTITYGDLEVFRAQRVPAQAAEREEQEPVDVSTAEGKVVKRDENPFEGFEAVSHPSFVTLDVDTSKIGHGGLVVREYARRRSANREHVYLVRSTEDPNRLLVHFLDAEGRVIVGGPGPKSSTASILLTKAGNKIFVGGLRIELQEVGRLRIKHVGFQSTGAGSLNHGLVHHAEFVPDETEPKTEGDKYLAVLQRINDNSKPYTYTSQREAVDLESKLFGDRLRELFFNDTDFNDNSKPYTYTSQREAVDLESKLFGDRLRELFFNDTDINEQWKAMEPQSTNWRTLISPAISVLNSEKTSEDAKHLARRVLVALTPDHAEEIYSGSVDRQQYWKWYKREVEFMNRYLKPYAVAYTSNVDNPAFLLHLSSDDFRLEVFPRNVAQTARGHTYLRLSNETEEELIKAFREEFSVRLPGFFDHVELAVKIDHAVEAEGETYSRVAIVRKEDGALVATLGNFFVPGDLHGRWYLNHEEMKISVPAGRFETGIPLGFFGVETRTEGLPQSKTFDNPPRIQFHGDVFEYQEEERRELRTDIVVDLVKGAKASDKPLVIRRSGRYVLVFHKSELEEGGEVRPVGVIDLLDPKPVTVGPMRLERLPDGRFEWTRIDGVKAGASSLAGVEIATFVPFGDETSKAGIEKFISELKQEKPGKAVSESQEGTVPQKGDRSHGEQAPATFEDQIQATLEISRPQERAGALLRLFRARAGLSRKELGKRDPSWYQPSPSLLYRWNSRTKNHQIVKEVSVQHLTRIEDGNFPWKLKTYYWLNEGENVPMIIRTLVKRLVAYQQKLKKERDEKAFDPQRMKKLLNDEFKKALKTPRSELRDIATPVILSPRTRPRAKNLQSEILRPDATESRGLRMTETGEKWLNTEQALRQLNTSSVVLVDARDLLDNFSEKQKEEFFARAYLNGEQVELVIYNAEDAFDDALTPFRKLWQNVHVIEEGANEAEELAEHLQGSVGEKAILHVSKGNFKPQDQLSDTETSEIYFFRYDGSEDRTGLLAVALLYVDFVESTDPTKLKEGLQWLGIERDSDGFLTVIDHFLARLDQEFRANLVIRLSA